MTTRRCCEGDGGQHTPSCWSQEGWKPYVRPPRCHHPAATPDLAPGSPARRPHGVPLSLAPWRAARTNGLIHPADVRPAPACVAMEASKVVDDGRIGDGGPTVAEPEVERLGSTVAMTVTLTATEPGFARSNFRESANMEAKTTPDAPRTRVLVRRRTHPHSCRELASPLIPAGPSVPEPFNAFCSPFPRDI
jgi:hypothetical protein